MQTKVLSVIVEARFTLSGWAVRLVGGHSSQMYYVLDSAVVVLPPEHTERGERQSRLREYDGGKVLVGYSNSLVQFIRTVGPNELLKVELPLDDVDKLLKRMRDATN
jgi:hypothetical protein